ncbi:glycosyltransferase family 39 protein [Clostridium sp.]|uniref:glycosyltransferase family 39 protein n=1 Tax=Clostridium sp. TaxID=1506 RepID=UPI002851FFD0|nr:glycosyltransferase 87 family protein [Clostridium sp.]MDR3598815.1 glycosyltransferase family 39 protein [Clostridium sp.]
MGIVNFKKYTIMISLIFMILISAFLCIYALENYKSSNNTSQYSEFKSNGDAATENKNKQIEQNKGKMPLDENMQPGFDDNKQPGSDGNIPAGGNVNHKYVPALTAYSGVFLILYIGSYYFFRRRNIEVDFANEKLVICTLLFTGFLLRIAASTLIEGYRGDIDLFKNWAVSAANSLSGVYSGSKPPDYPPLYMYILAVIGKIASISVLNSYYVILLKLPAIIADIITTYFIYRLGKKYFNAIISILLAASYAFNPAIFIDSTLWGQVDSLFTLLIITGIFLLSEKKIIFSSSMFAVAVLMKPQGIIFFPILFFELVQERKIRNFIYAALSAVATCIIIIIPFAIKQESPIWIFNLYLNTIKEYPYASMNAFNLFSLLGANFKKDTETLFLFNYHTIGMFFIVIITCISWLIYIKGNNRKFIASIALLQIAGVFTFSSGMHERYLFPAVVLSVLAFVYLKDNRFIILSIGFSITTYVNILAILFSIDSEVFNLLLKIVSLLNVILVIYVIKILFNNAFTRIPELTTKEND